MSAGPQFPVVLDSARCADCGKCLDACPTGVFQRPEPGAKPMAVFAKDCHVCFLCVPDCPSGAITVSWEAPNLRQISVYDVLGLDLDPATFPSTGEP
ncbi:Ferredoxin-2 [Pigmentiphaga humi]|uniref:Ferredoxin-2 n=1 Tax=Pigmentiphaga humi TaxID=2478468 RepID=A0A3P4B5G5_9BURK|nr:ferredoxin family protein [Pigmentiphaga humi]VCU70776.1 Ferredoxin-2 [Pigmentiphaga humi]